MRLLEGGSGGWAWHGLAGRIWRGGRPSLGARLAEGLVRGAPAPDGGGDCGRCRLAPAGEEGGEGRRRRRRWRAAASGSRRCGVRQATGGGGATSRSVGHVHGAPVARVPAG